jgi:hypothetical protein
VDLPWSIWAMMQKFLMIAGSVAAGTGAVRAIGDTDGSLLSDMRTGNAAGTTSTQILLNSKCPTPVGYPRTFTAVMPVSDLRRPRFQ